MPASFLCTVISCTLFVVRCYFLLSYYFTSDFMVFCLSTFDPPNANDIDYMVQMGHKSHVCVNLTITIDYLLRL